jgi:hypothetical protein
MPDPPKSPDIPDPDKSPDIIEHLSHHRPGRSDDQEEDDLVEDLPPGPDSPVIEKTSRIDLERGWFLGVFLAILVLTVIFDLAGSALLPAARWTQMKPEVGDVRGYLFQVAGIIIGFYFGTTVGRGKKS